MFAFVAVVVAGEDLPPSVHVRHGGTVAAAVRGGDRHHDHRLDPPPQQEAAFAERTAQHEQRASAHARDY